MEGGIYRGIIVPHAPRMGKPELVPDFQKDIVAGIAAMGEDIRADKPDVMIVCSTHHVSTFNWIVSTVPEHKNRCVAMEAPDMISGEPYHYKGDPELGLAIKSEIEAGGFPCVENATPHYSWDYGTWVPVHYMDPEGAIPIIIVPVVQAADLKESYNVGEAIDRACRKTGRRAVFAASTALAHHLVRGPAEWPTEERRAADRVFIDSLLKGEIEAAWRGFEDYARLVVAEMGGRALATLLGGLAASQGGNFDTAQFGPYAQSSGSGNVNLSMTVAA